MGTDGPASNGVTVICFQGVKESRYHVQQPSGKEWCFYAFLPSASSLAAELLAGALKTPRMQQYPMGIQHYSVSAIT